MQFGIFSVSDITRNAVTGHTPSEAERIRAIVRLAQRADEVGLDVFAIGEHHNPPFFSSSPTTVLGHIAALTRANHPQHRGNADHDQRPGQDRRGLRDAPAPCERPGGSDARPRQYGTRCIRGSARTSATGSSSRSRTTTSCIGCGARTSSTGREASGHRCRALRRFRGRSTTFRRSSGTARSAPRRSRSRRPTTATATSPTTSSPRTSTSCRS